MGYIEKYVQGLAFRVCVSNLGLGIQNSELVLGECAA